MSCFVVSDYHVSALVAWAIRRGLDLDASPDAVAHVLASANRRAYSERYQGRFNSELVAFGGLDRTAGADLAPVAIVKACDCLDYQASDWSRWDDSDASGYLALIRRAAVALADPAGSASASGRALPGYDAAAWSLDRPERHCPHCDRHLDSVAELTAGLCTSDDCPRHDAAERDRRLATLDYPEHEIEAIRAALAATRCAA